MSFFYFFYFFTKKHQKAPKSKNQVFLMKKDATQEKEQENRHKKDKDVRLRALRRASEIMISVTTESRPLAPEERGNAREGTGERAQEGHRGNSRNF